MTTFMRNVHRLAVAAQLAGGVFWAYVFAVEPSWLALLWYIWCIAFGAYSYNALRAERKGIRA